MKFYILGLLGRNFISFGYLGIDRILFIFYINGGLDYFVYLYVVLVIVIFFFVICS